MSQRAVFHGQRDDLRAILSQVMDIVGGRAPDPLRVAQGIQLRAGVALLSQIQQDFIRKSRGGVGLDGIVWPPLSPKTIAQRRVSGAEKKALGIGGRRVRGLLTPQEDKEWRKIYGSRLAKLRMHMPEGQARAKAAAIAWAVMKQRGAKTKLAVLGSRKVDILRDTGELLRSFSPGIEDRPSGADGQIFRTEPGAVIVGSNKKPQHHRGIKGRLPARPFWPLDGKIPDAWMPAVRTAVATGLARLIVQLARNPSGVG